MENTENQIEKILQLLTDSNLTAYYIASKTGISEQTILNYRNKKTTPTEANAKLLEYFFADDRVNKGKKYSKNSENTINGNHNVIGDNASIDNRQYYSDSPDVLRAQIEELERLMSDKEERLKEKDAQIKEKDAQIHRLLSIVEASVASKNGKNDGC